MKQSYIIALILFLLGACTEKHQYFTGQVEYDYSYESNILGMDSLSRVKAYKSLFRYDLNNYQSQFIGKDTFTYYYSGAINKCVSQTNSQGNFECEDYSMPNDSILWYKIYDTEEKVYGYTCKIIEYQTRLFWNRYYVSKELRIAPGTYQKHIAYNWSFYGEKAEGGVILKLEHRFRNYTMKGIVTNLVNDTHSFKALEIDQRTINKICD